MQTSIKQLFIYPIKSMMGVPVTQLEFTSKGVLHDRRYLLVDSHNKMLTQRSHAIMSQFKLERIEESWLVTSPTGSTIVIHDKTQGTVSVATSVWKTPLTCVEKSTGISDWFSKQLKEPVRLVELDQAQSRIKQADGIEAPLAFADGYPLLVCNQNSLEALNRTLDEPISMERFRANIIIDLPEDAEFDLAGMQGESGIQLSFSEPCVRCNVPAINPQTSDYSRALHQQLKQLLVRENKVVFGVNAVVENGTKLNLQEKLTVV